MATEHFTFPANFLWGTATAAHQVEGNNLNCDFWVLEHTPGSPFVEPSGDACDQYHRYADDIAMLARLGFNSYRFSIEWARVEPEPGEFSRAALDHYRRVLACCHEHKITPVVTFHHFTSPRWLAGDGGWEDKKTAELFARYCERTAAHLGDLIGIACTINEANLGAYQYLIGSMPLKLDPSRLKWLSEAARRIGADPNRFAPYPNVRSDEGARRDARRASPRGRRAQILARQISGRHQPRARRLAGRARRRGSSRSHQGRMPGHLLRGRARRRFHRRPDLHPQPHQRRRHATPRKPASRPR